MDLVQLDIIDGSPQETSSELSPDSSDDNDIFGEPLVHPRVGPDYQSEIPPLLTEYEHLQLLRNPDDSEARLDVSHSFLIGRPVSLMWAYKEADPVKNESRSKTAQYKYVYSVNGTKRENVEYDKGEDCKNDGHDDKYIRSVSFPVPGVLSESWNDFEDDCFILGLYIFGKNLLRVKEFMESKEMGQILSFYYGKFYRSSAYCRWSDLRKMKNKKRIIGYKLFSGCRLQELFFRLSPHLSEGNKNSLYEISKSFAEGRTSLEDYVSSLKAFVGIETLVEIVGIGKGNDLTNLVVETSKANCMFSFRPEVPFGKACSSLSTSDVINFLTGDFRLSKARSNDLFWEAVWPRMLAKGWHSETPKNGAYTSAKDHLVFIMPGIRKFSRRKLVKGDHYFDSVSDMLKLVASKPELLEPDAEEELRASKHENGWAATEVMNSDNSNSNSSDGECPRYLQPRISVSNASMMKFMVVDTSIDHGENPRRVRELRTLPAETKQIFSVTGPPRTGGTTTGLPAGNTVVEPEFISVSSKQGSLNGSVGCDRKKTVGSHERDPISTFLSADQKTKGVKKQFSHHGKHVLMNRTAPVTKRRRVPACRKGSNTINFQIIPGVKLEGTCCVLALEMDKESHSQRNAPSVNSSAASIPEEDNGLNKQSSCVGGVDSNKSPHGYITVKPEVHQDLFDLNLPRMEASNANNCLEGFDALSTGRPQKSIDEYSGISKQEQPTTMGGRRKSTRSRALSTKAWEALEVDWMNLRQSKKQRPQTWAQEPNAPNRRHVECNASSNNYGGGVAAESEERLSNGISDDLTWNTALIQTDGVIAAKVGLSGQASDHL